MTVQRLTGASWHVNTTTTAGSMLRVNGDVGISGEIRGNNNVVIPDGTAF